MQHRLCRVELLDPNLRNNHRYTFFRLNAKLLVIIVSSIRKKTQNVFRQDRQK